ncbi:MAG: hypothetical protein RL701_1546 [Pseudomonadota bacterium]|jgi:hypothetical protein
MAQIKRRSDTDRNAITLMASHMIGRDRENHTAIERPSISGQHALFSWNGSGWRVRDLGSRNGTYVNGRLLQARENAAIAAGDEIAFAERDEVWAVLNAHPPTPTLISLVGAAPMVLVDGGGFFLAHADDDSSWNVFYAAGNWYLEDQLGTRRVIDNDDRVELDGHVYRVSLPAGSAETRDAHAPPVEARLENAHMTIQVSTDEETAAITLDLGQRRYDFEARAHLYLLAYLARARQADADGTTGGWVYTEKAVRDLQLSCGTQLSVHVFRCRSELGSAIANPADVVDRSRRGLLRIGLSADRLVVRNAAN